MYRLFLLSFLLLPLFGADATAKFQKTKLLCDRGSASACALMYSYYMQNKQTFVPGLKPSLRKALFYAEKACDLGDEDGCFFAGMTLYYGDEWGKIERDREKGKVYIQKACKLGKEDVCSYFPNNLE